MPESSKPSRRVTLRRALGDLLRPSRAQLLLAVVLYVLVARHRIDVASIEESFVEADAIRSQPQD